MRALSPAELFAAYHSAGHAIAAGAIEELSRGVPNRRPPLQNALFEGWLNFTASGHAAEKELACRLGLRWRRVVSNAGDDLEACRLLIGEQTGEDHRDWILLHWTRAVARATRLLTANWSEVVKLAELQASYHRDADPLCPAKALTEVGHSRTDCWNRWWDEAIRRRRDDRYRPTGGYLAHDRAEPRPLQSSRSGGVSRS